MPCLLQDRTEYIHQNRCQSSKEFFHSLKEKEENSKANDEWFMQPHLNLPTHSLDIHASRGYEEFVVIVVVAAAAPTDDAVVFIQSKRVFLTSMNKAW